MTDKPGDPAKELSGTLRGSWQLFLDVYEPLRPELYRYCRYLTRSPWDAEDRLSRWRNYFFTPDVIAEICRELGVPFRTNSYRYWRATR
jgi:hypothetical protein